MPHPKQQQAKEPAVSTDTSAAAAPVMPTAVAIMKGPPLWAVTLKHERTKNKRLPTDYVSPLKKLKKPMHQKERRVIDTIDGLRDFIVDNDMSDPEIRSSIRIQARLLFTAAESIRGLHFLCLYLGEQHAPEPLHEQQNEYKEAQHDDLFQPNQFLTPSPRTRSRPTTRTSRHWVPSLRLRQRSYAFTTTATKSMRKYRASRRSFHRDVTTPSACTHCQHNSFA
ncbi:hypothetical protein V7S43_016625 [Phytophthora oleae]|uniref:Uncharacterized protein n=1 Tax=Phytophthora oleae TaxID=2107226 RepID=A0ABD3EVK4_9STRA